MSHNEFLRSLPGVIVPPAQYVLGVFKRTVTYVELSLLKAKVHRNEDTQYHKLTLALTLLVT